MFFAAAVADMHQKQRAILKKITQFHNGKTLRLFPFDLLPFRE